jgi:hypothetical protein
MEEDESAQDQDNGDGARDHVFLMYRVDEKGVRLR